MTRGRTTASFAALMKVSIVLPCYNAGPFLERCLDGLFAQTHRPLELIAVDDGSSDETLGILKAAVSRSPIPMTVRSQPNRGACAARNHGLMLADGEYIQFMDADDVLLPEKIAWQARAARENALPDLVVGSARTFAPDEHEKGISVQRPEGRDPWLDLARHRLGRTPSNLWKRASVVAVDGWDERMRSSQEYDLMFRMLKNGARVIYDSAVLTEVHLQESGSISTRRLDQTWKRFIELRVRIIEHLRATRSDADMRPYWQSLFDSIRTLYAYDPMEAIALHDRLMPDSFRPGLSPATGRAYLVLHRMFGFAWANRIRRMLTSRS